jgi:peptidoglycan/xylan/chitin deacetylase (PgdA/CDA1 family)
MIQILPKNTNKVLRAGGFSTAALLLLSFFSPALTYATAQNPTATPLVSFTFDDALASDYTTAAPTLAANGLVGTSYVSTGCVGMTTTPNQCLADGNAPYMSWDQVTQLQNTYGWEIAGHTISHPQLATDGLTDQQLANEIAGGKQDLASHGITATDFATPYGDYDNRVLAAIAREYASHRGFHDVATNLWPYNDYLLNDMQVQSGVTVAQVKARVDQAIANKEWLVLTFHDIKAVPSTNPDDYQYATSDLNEIAAYVKSKQDAGQIKSVTVNKGLVGSTTNLLGSSSFDNGIADGWTTNNTTAVTKDTARNGNFVPGNSNAATNSAKLVASTSNVYLFSPKVTIDSTQQYLIKSFLNLTARTSGELGYYIDEYDAAGNWISGQWKKAETTPFVKTNILSYTPSSASVKQASLQVYVQANSGITAYVDNVQWFSPTDTTPPPPSTDPVNVMPNSTFDGGIGSGWTTDNTAAIKADNGSHGSTENPVNSVKMDAGTANAHLFSPQVAVDNTVTYTIKAFLNILNIASGEVGFYVDEYDAAGNWISGQYILGKRTTGSEVISFDYQPSSLSVKKARLQIILVGNSGISAYVDNVQWLAPAGSTPPPDPTPTPTPTTTTIQQNDFSTGLADGWTTDQAGSVVADASGNGGNDEATNSIKLTATAASIHLFGPKVAVTSAKTYTIQSYLNITALTSGEVAYYVDEYDAAGNWISGQYIYAQRTAGAGTVSFNYVPSSASVAQASLQVIVTANSGITAYLDSLKWTATS